MATLSAVVERSIRSRLARLFLASTLIALSAWAFYPHVAYRISPTAYVNAELVRVTAPLAGRLARDLPRKGDIIDHSMTVKLTETLSPDRRHLLDIEQRVALSRDRADLAKRQLAEIATADLELEVRLDAYRSGMVMRLSQEIAEAVAEKTGCMAEGIQRRDIGTRMEQLAKLGYTSQIRTADAVAIQEAITTRCEMAKARIQRLEIESNSATSGVFLRDGASEVPYSQQQRDRLLLRRQELETELLQQSSGAERLQTELTEERNRLERIGHSDLFLPAGHVVWSVSASPGSTVTEGQTILDLANCAHRFVVVELAEREFEQTKPGDMASVRLIGSDDWQQGKVRQVLGSAARTDDRLLAAQFARSTSNSIVAEVELPENLSDTDRNGFCNVGRMAEVRFLRTGAWFTNRVSKVMAWMTHSEGQPKSQNETTDQ